MNTDRKGYLPLQVEMACDSRSWLLAWETWLDYFADYPPYRRGEYGGPRQIARDAALDTIKTWGDRRDECAREMCLYAYADVTPFTAAEKARMAP